MMKKGLTPIIAIVLLLMMTIAAFGLAYVWLTSFQKQTQSEVEAVVKEKLSQLGTQLQVLSVYEDGGDTKILLYNNGKNIIPGDVLGSVVVLINGKPQTASPSTTNDVPPRGNFEIILQGYAFSNLKNNELNTITIKMGDIEVNYPCGPIPTSDPRNSC